MGYFPALTAKQVLRALKQAGFIEDRQKGSHLILINQATKARTVIPIHPGKTNGGGISKIAMKGYKSTEILTNIIASVTM